MVGRERTSEVVHVQRQARQRGLLELRQLVQKSDSIELKVTVPEHARRSTNAALGIDPLEAQIRQVYFFDTHDLDLAGEQQTKTKTALEFFSAELRAART